MDYAKSELAKFKDNVVKKNTILFFGGGGGVNAYN